MKRFATALLVCSSPIIAADLVVAPSGGDYTSIQAALDAAFAGDLVLVQDKPGGWNERLVFPRSGTLGAPIQLLAAPGHAPALDGTGIPGIWMITIEDRDYIQVQGLEIRNNLGVVNDGSGVRVQGACAGVELRNLVIHDMRGFGAMGITVYGSQAGASISDLVIDGCTVYDCEPADSEAITLNGNVTGFAVTNNVVRDVNNIGIDFIGGEFGSAAVFQARNGVCRGNVVLRANSNYGGGYGAGIYVDGGRDIVIEHNYVSGCDLGIEVGAENVGVDSTNILVHSNVIVRNEKVGLVFGGYDQSVGRVRDCTFANNTLLRNDTLQDGNGEIWVQWANDCDVVNNVVWPGAGDRGVASYSTTTGNRFLANAYFADVSEAQVVRGWQGTDYSGLAAWTGATGFDASSFFADPSFVDADGTDDVLGTPDDLLRPQTGSAVVDGGDSSLVLASQTTDYTGAPRVLGASIEVGAYEVLAASSTIRNGTGANPLVLTEVSPAVIGGTWTGTYQGISSCLLFVTSASLPGVPTAFGELLIANEAFGAVTYTTSLTTPAIATFTAGIPPNPALVGLVAHAQAVLVTSPLQLTNALELTLGY